MKHEEYDVMNVEGGSHVKMWTKGVPVEDAAKKQLTNTAKMPFIYKHIAVMPDVHLGKGSTIGSVIPTLGAIIPAAVGVDIGCGMMAAKTTLTANDLPDNLGPLRSAIERAMHEIDKHFARPIGNVGATAIEAIFNFLFEHRRIVLMAILKTRQTRVHSLSFGREKEYSQKTRNQRNPSL